MLKHFVSSELRKQFPEMEIEFGGKSENVIATILPVHNSWKPIVIRDDGSEATVFYGDFTHDHYKYYGENVPAEAKARVITANIVEELASVFADKIEFWRGKHSGGMGPIGASKTISYLPSGTKAKLWSGRDSL